MKTLIYTFALTFSFLKISSQNDSTKQKVVMGNGCYTSLTQLVFPELTLTYEHFLKEKFSLSTTLGYKLPVGKGNRVDPFGTGIFGVYENNYMLNRFSNAVFLSVAPSFYFDKERKFYFQLELFNRYYWLDKRDIFFNGTKPFYDERRERNNVTGLRLLIGTNIKWSISKSLFLNAKLHAGLGFVYKVYNYEIFEIKDFNNLNSQQVSISNIERKGTVKNVYLQFGLKLGLARKTTQTKRN